MAGALRQGSVQATADLAMTSALQRVMDDHSESLYSRPRPEGHASASSVEYGMGEGGQMQDRQAEQIQSLLATLQATTEDAARQRQAATEAMRMLDSVHRQASESASRVQFLEAELESAVRGHASELSVVESRLAAAAAEAEDARARAEAAEARAMTAEAKIAASHAVDDMEMLRLQRDHAALHKELAGAAAKIGEAQSQTAEARAHVSALQAEVRSLRQELSKQQALQDECRALAEGRDQALSAAMQAREAMQRLHADYGGRMAELQKALTSMSTKLSSTAGQASRAASERDAARAEVAARRSDVEMLTKELAETKGEVALLKGRLASKKDGSPSLDSSVRSPHSVRFAVRSSPGGSTPPSSALQAPVSPPLPPPSPALDGTQENMMALMVYAQKLEAEMQAEKRRTAAAQIAFVLYRAVHRRVTRGWQSLGAQNQRYGRAEQDEGQYEQSHSPSGHRRDSSSASNLELLAASPLLGLAGQGEGGAGGGRKEEKETGARKGGSKGMEVMSAATDCEHLLSELGSIVSVLTVSSLPEHERQEHLQRALQRLYKCKGALAILTGWLASPSNSRDTAGFGAAFTVGSDPTSRMRSALNAAHDRADQAEAEARGYREECAEVRTKLTALQTSVKALLVALGQPQNLGSTPSAIHEASLLSPPTGSLFYGRGAAAEQDQDSLYGPGTAMDEGLLEAALVGTLGLPAAPPFSRPAASSAVPLGPTPEAVQQATNTLAVMKVHLASLVMLAETKAGEQPEAADTSTNSALSSLLSILQLDTERPPAFIPSLAPKTKGNRERTFSWGGADPQALLVAVKANPTSFASVVRKLERALKALLQSIPSARASPVRDSAARAIGLAETDSAGSAGAGSRGSHDSHSLSPAAHARTSSVDAMRRHDEAVGNVARAAQLECIRLREAELSSETARLVRDDIDARVRESARLVADLRAQIEAGERLQRATEAKASSLSSRVDELSCEVEALSTELENSKAAYARSRAEIDSLKAMMRETLTEAKRSFHAEVDALTAAKQAALAQVQHGQQQLAEARAAAEEDAAKARAEAEAKVASLTAEFQRQLEEARDAASSELDKRLCEAQQANDISLAMLQMKHEEYTGTVEEGWRKRVEEAQAQTQAEADARLSEVTELHHRLQDAGMALQEKDEQFAALRAEFDQLRDRAEQLAQVLSSVTSELETQMAALQDAQSSDGRTAVQLEEELSACRGEVQDLQAKVRVLNEEMEDMRTQHGEEVEGLKQEMAFAVQAAEDHAKSYVARMLGTSVVGGSTGQRR